jgi:hypothetical protein
MKQIGIISENPNDTAALKALFEREYKDLECFDLLPRINGSELDDKRSNKAVRILRRNYEIYEPDYVLYVRDLDGFLYEKEKVVHRKQRFTKFNKVVDKKAIFMLNIYEIEALILADFDCFKTFFDNKDWDFDTKRAHLQENPKEKLMEFAPYKEADCIRLFEKINIKTLCENHPHFAKFMIEFNKMLTSEKFKPIIL